MDYSSSPPSQGKLKGYLGSCDSGIGDSSLFVSNIGTPSPKRVSALSTDWVSEKKLSKKGSQIPLPIEKTDWRKFEKEAGKFGVKHFLKKEEVDVTSSKAFKFLSRFHPKSRQDDRPIASRRQRSKSVDGRHKKSVSMFNSAYTKVISPNSMRKRDEWANTLKSDSILDEEYYKLPYEEINREILGRFSKSEPRLNRKLKKKVSFSEEVEELEISQEPSSEFGKQLMTFTSDDSPYFVEKLPAQSKTMDFTDTQMSEDSTRQAMVCTENRSTESSTELADLLDLVKEQERRLSDDSSQGSEEESYKHKPTPLPRTIMTEDADDDLPTDMTDDDSDESVDSDFPETETESDGLTSDSYEPEEMRSPPNGRILSYMETSFDDVVTEGMQHRKNKNNDPYYSSFSTSSTIHEVEEPTEDLQYYEEQPTSLDVICELPDEELWSTNQSSIKHGNQMDSLTECPEEEDSLLDKKLDLESSQSDYVNGSHPARNVDSVHVTQTIDSISEETEANEIISSLSQDNVLTGQSPIINITRAQDLNYENRAPSPSSEEDSISKELQNSVNNQHTLSLNLDVKRPSTPTPQSPLNQELLMEFPDRTSTPELHQHLDSMSMYANEQNTMSPICNQKNLVRNTVPGDASPDYDSETEEQLLYGTKRFGDETIDDTSDAENKDQDIDLTSDSGKSSSPSDHIEYDSAAESSSENEDLHANVSNETNFDSSFNSEDSLLSKVHPKDHDLSKNLSQIIEYDSAADSDSDKEELVCSSKNSGINKTNVNNTSSSIVDSVSSSQTSTINTSHTIMGLPSSQITEISHEASTTTTMKLKESIHLPTSQPSLTTLNKHPKRVNSTLYSSFTKKSSTEDLTKDVQLQNKKKIKEALSKAGINPSVLDLLDEEQSLSKSDFQTSIANMLMTKDQSTRDHTLVLHTRTNTIQPRVTVTRMRLPLSKIRGGWLFSSDPLIQCMEPHPQPVTNLPKFDTTSPSPSTYGGSSSGCYSEANSPSPTVTTVREIPLPTLI